ncbi:E3 ubiquitin-protein ligase mib2 [Bulinus truncatus]|nr:E3 ubiquitin-protein ligase mib2 [Bulinus truncatus]
MKAGLRVVRGPDWKWGNDDGGEGHLGTIIETEPGEGKVTVLWDHGAKKIYRAGQAGAYDLYAFDNAQICVKHPTVTCDECKEKEIIGIRWNCSVCTDFDLCCDCYSKDKHSLSHSFLRFDSNNGKSIKVPPRQGCQKYQAWGIFQSATVTRGLHWKWDNQDGGEGTHGFVMKIKDWEPSFRSQAQVLWANGNGYTYRIGHSGMIDLKCVKAASGGFYYKTHLPVVGKMEIDSRGDDVVASMMLLQEHILKPLTALLNFGEILSSLKEVAQEYIEKIKPGIRVVRGPDWKWGSQDGGEGFVGTVTAIGGPEPDKPPEKCVSVVWDNGSKNTYRIGRDNAYDLRILDNAPSGVKHKNITCDGCRASPIQGIRWRCTSCFNYDLCSQCYNSNMHVTGHMFWRYDKATNNRFKVPRRCGSRKLQCKGIFTNAIVSRGPDWKWGAQDAGTVNNGLVLSIKPWDASETANSAAEVLWANENQNTYRLGHSGSVDLKFVTEASGGDYYPDHLPILGKVERSPCEFKVGDIVKCCFDVDLVKILQNNHGGWTDLMAKYVTLLGTVVQIDQDDDVVVLYDDGRRWYFNQDALCKVADMTSVTHSPMDSDVVRKVLELGFEKAKVQAIVLKRFSEGQAEFTNIDSLVNEVLDSQQQDSINVIRDDSASHVVLSENQRVDELSASMSGLRLEVDSETISENQRLARENEFLREQRQCKVCMDNEACITFVPCGHLISCDACYPSLQLCPICRKNIEGTLRTYIS